MGAAVRDSDGRIHVGLNLAHFTGGPCAELVALGSARAHGTRQIRTIVAYGNHGRGVLGPCGRDRQILFDYHPGIRVLLPTEEGVRATTIEELMPFAAAWTVDAGTKLSIPLDSTNSRPSIDNGAVRDVQMHRRADVQSGFGGEFSVGCTPRGRVRSGGVPGIAENERFGVQPVPLDPLYRTRRPAARCWRA